MVERQKSPKSWVRNKWCEAAQNRYHNSGHQSTADDEILFIIVIIIIMLYCVSRVTPRAVTW